MQLVQGIMKVGGDRPKKIQNRLQNGNFTSNLVMLYYQGKHKPTYYLPTYVRVKVLNISELKYEELSAQLNVEVYITVVYPNVKIYRSKDNSSSSTLKQEILNRGIKCSFEKGPCINLKRDNADVSIYDDLTNNEVTYVIRKFISTTLDCKEMYWAPFERIECRLSLSMNRVRIYDKHLDTMNQIHFNLMDNQNEDKKLLTSESSNFGLFEICKSQLTANYTTSLLITKEEEPEEIEKKKRKMKKKYKNKRMKKEDEHLPLLKKNYGKERPDAFNSAHFIIPLFKKPTVAVLTIFIPLFLMAVISLGIFLELPNLHKRIVSIAGLMVSFVALIPTIREQIPPTPKITIGEILVFIQSLTTLFALFDSLALGDDEQAPFTFDASTNGLFLFSLLITIIVNITILILYLLYKCKWKDEYIRKDKEELVYHFEDQLEHFDWDNKACNREFFKFYDKGMIQLIVDNTISEGILLKFGMVLKEERDQEKEDEKQQEVYQDQLSFEALLKSPNQKRKPK